jgi:hypothetical protein
LPGGGDSVTAGLAGKSCSGSAGVAGGRRRVPRVHEGRRAPRRRAGALRLDALEPLLRRLTAIDAIAKQARPGSMADRALARKVLETEAAASSPWSSGSTSGSTRRCSSSATARAG